MTATLLTVTIEVSYLSCLAFSILPVNGHIDFVHGYPFSQRLRLYAESVKGRAFDIPGSANEPQRRDHPKP
jgi:hypothetical protein